MITLSTSTPLKEAAAAMGRRSPVGSVLSSAEWEGVAPEIRERAFFMARVESEKILHAARRRIAQRINMERDRAEDGGRVMERSRFIVEMQALLDEMGYRPDPDHAGGLRDFSSHRRLRLVWDMNLAMAHGHAQWKGGQDEVALKTRPAQELIRVMPRREMRNWPKIWEVSGGKFYGKPGPDYPLAAGRMIALKTDPIWRAISRFETPWAPFDWGSGMGLRPVRRREALELGVVKPGDPPQKPLGTPFNEGARASVKGLPAASRRAIEEDLAGDVEMVGDEMRMIPPPSFDASGGTGGSNRGRKRGLDFDDVDHPVAAHEPVPLEMRVSVSRSRRYEAEEEAVRSALELAGTVHDDGVIPAVVAQVRLPLLLPKAGGVYRPSGGPERLPLLRINPNATDPKLAMLHELGHLLDNHGLHRASGQRLYASEGQPELKPLMRALVDSSAYRRLVERETATGEIYWTRPRELFARSYAQWIAAETGDADLEASILAVRRREREDVSLWKESQWTRMDFQGIKKEFRRLFTKKGWLK